MAYETPYSYIYELCVLRGVQSSVARKMPLKLYERKHGSMNLLPPVMALDDCGTVITNNWCAVSCSEGVWTAHRWFCVDVHGASTYPGVWKSRGGVSSYMCFLTIRVAFLSRR